MPLLLEGLPFVYPIPSMKAKLVPAKGWRRGMRDGAVSGVKVALQCVFCSTILCKFSFYHREGV